MLNESESEIIADRTSAIFLSRFEIVSGIFVGTSKQHYAIRRIQISMRPEQRQYITMKHISRVL
jgi:hypothetical protein